MSFLHLVKGGDWLVTVLFVALTAVLIPLAFRGGRAEMAVVKSGGRVVAQLPLTGPRTLEVEGPLGVTRIEVQPGRARVAADPGPRQYCVRQGWLTRANAIAICAPNHVSLALVGRDPAYDSISY